MIMCHLQEVKLSLLCPEKKPNIMAQHNVIYIEAWCARDIPLGLACTRNGFDTSISLANQVYVGHMPSV